MTTPDSEPVMVASFELPSSVFLSPQSQQFLQQEQQRQLRLQEDCPSPVDDINAYRQHLDSQYFFEIIARLKDRYAVTIESTTIAGVAVDIIAPVAVAADYQDKVLINLHGGMFMVGGGGGGQAESIPIADLSGYKVISIDYRMHPEYAYPAATEDVIAVYQALLKDYSADNIAIYGSSAGAILGGQVIAQLLREGLPVPAAIGMIGGAPLPIAGDANYFSAAITASPPIHLHDLAYLKDVAEDDAEALPGLNNALLKQFPPTVLITATRDLVMGQVVTMHNRLIQNGAEAELYVWDGVGHVFTVIPGLPEAEQALAVLAQFLCKHLQSKP